MTGAFPPGVPPTDLPLRARLTYAAHLFKAVTQQHHRALRPLLAPHIPVDAVLFDVGGHAGQFAKLFARLARRGRVYCFEPGSYARSILTRAVRLNRLHHIEIIAAAVGAAPGSVDLRMPIKPNGVRRFGVSHIVADPAATDAQPGRAETGRMVTESVPVLTLDGFVAERGIARVDFIKADIEGFEGRLLAGAEETLARHRPVLLLELVDRMLARGGDRLETVWARLRDAGYAADATTMPPKPVPGPRDGEFLFLPTKRS